MPPGSGRAGSQNRLPAGAGMAVAQDMEQGRQQMSRHKTQATPMFGELVKKIEELSGRHFSLRDAAPFDLRQERAREAQLAAEEIARARMQARRRAISELHARGDVDLRYCFDTIIRDEHNVDAVNGAQLFSMTAGQEQAAPSLLIIQGAEGSGKTVLCHAIANEWLDKVSGSVCIVGFEELRRSFLPSQNEEHAERREREAQWEQYCSRRLLLVDGFLASRNGLSAFMQQLFGGLLRRRAERHLPMVITTPVEFGSLRLAVGTYCFESMCDYVVMTKHLYGASRRRPIVADGRQL